MKDVTSVLMELPNSKAELIQSIMAITIMMLWSC